MKSCISLYLFYNVIGAESACGPRVWDLCYCQLGMLLITLFLGWY